jgi:hypothetical protein
MRKQLVAQGESDIDRKVLTLVPTLEDKTYFFLVIPIGE